MTLYERYTCLKSKKEQIEQAVNILIASYKNGGMLLLCGNGGSAADCSHITGELMKGFLLKRPLEEELIKRFTDFGEKEMGEKLQGSLPAISLVENNALISAFSNDVEPDYIFAQQVIGLGKKEDVLFAVSTSGNAVNVCKAVTAAKVIGMKTIALTGRQGGKLAECAELVIQVPEEETWKVQELHLPVYHWICACVEQYFWDH